MPKLIDATTWYPVYRHSADPQTAHSSYSLITPYRGQDGVEYTALCGAWVMPQGDHSNRRLHAGLSRVIIAELPQCETCAHIEHSTRPDAPVRPPESFLK